MGTKIWDPERSPEQGPEWKNDIQSWVLIRPFLASFGPRNGREFAIRPTKNADLLAHFEARELSYPMMTFLGHFWKVQNLEI